MFVASIVNHDISESLCDWVNPIDVGTRYMDVTNAFGGNIIDICADDWTAGVADAAASVEPHESWTLTHTAIEDSVRVFINGALQEPGMTSWIYSATDNTVYFSTIPSGGALVEIGYRYYEDEGDTGA